MNWSTSLMNENSLNWLQLVFTYARRQIGRDQQRGVPKELIVFIYHRHIDFQLLTEVNLKVDEVHMGLSWQKTICFNYDDTKREGLNP